MSFCKTCVEQSTDGSSVGRESCEDVGFVAMNAADNTNMLSRFREGDVAAIDVDWGDNLGIFYK